MKGGHPALSERNQGGVDQPATGPPLSLLWKWQPSPLSLFEQGLRQANARSVHHHLEMAEKQVLQIGRAKQPINYL